MSAQSRDEEAAQKSKNKRRESRHNRDCHRLIQMKHEQQHFMIKNIWLTFVKLSTMVDSSDFVEVTENINNQFHWMMLNIMLLHTWLNWRYLKESDTALLDHDIIW